MGVEHHGLGGIEMKLKNRLPLNIQFFAEGEGGNAPVGNTDTDQGQGAAEKGQEGTKTFDQILSDKAYQAEFDRRVAKALETAKGKWEADYNQKLEDAKSEAAKLAKMNADEKEKYERDKQEADYQKRVKELTVKELKAEAREQLVEKNLPKEFIDLLNYESADTVKESIDKMATTFQETVEKAVNDKLRGDGPPKAGSKDSSTLQTQIANAVRGII